MTAPEATLPLSRRVSTPLLALSLLLAAPCVAATAQEPEVTTFVQLTDPHLFDAETSAARLENQANLHRAVLRVNRLALSGRQVDFVVLTGDLGLETLQDSDLPEAVSLLAHVLDALSVREVFLVPGEHDLGTIANLTVFGALVVRLAEQLPQHKLTDLTISPRELNGIRFLGFDSTAVHQTDRIAENSLQLERIASQIVPGRMHVVFTHVPSLGEPGEGDRGGSEWRWRPESLRLAWTDFTRRPEIAAVFAGHLHRPRRAYYEAFYGTRGAFDEFAAVVKTWVAPPLGWRAWSTAPPPAQGFLLVTLDPSGHVMAVPQWLSETVSKPPAKKGKLIAGQLAYEEWRLNDATKAFAEALDSTDSWVLERAEEGLRSTTQRMRQPRWRLIEGFLPVRFLLDHWLELGLGLVIAGVYAGWQYFARNVRLGMPVGLSEKAPARHWIAELVAAIDHKTDVLGREGRSWRTPNATYARASTTLQDIAAGLPSTKGIDPVKLYALLAALRRYLGWHLESEVSGTPADATVYVSLRWAWKTQARWRVPDLNQGTTQLSAAAKKVASEILWHLG